MSSLVPNKHFVMSFFYTKMKFIGNMIILHTKFLNNYNVHI